jgi:DNA-binding response OmpR family regulator
MATTWRVLVVEDDPRIAGEVKEALESPGWLKDSSFSVEITTSFQEGLDALERFRFDILILDLRAESSGGKPDNPEAGLAVLERIKVVRFAPVVFYTALPNLVRALDSIFIRVVEKTEGITAVRAAVEAVIGTKLPYLNRYLEDQQRRYMWEYVADSSKELASPHHSVDLAFLMARRLAASLRVDFARLAAAEVGGAEAAPKTAKVHPIEFYILLP